MKVLLVLSLFTISLFFPGSGYASVRGLLPSPIFNDARPEFDEEVLQATDSFDDVDSFDRMECEDRLPISPKRARSPGPKKKQEQSPSRPLGIFSPGDKPTPSKRCHTENLQRIRKMNEPFKRMVEVQFQQFEGAIFAEARRREIMIGSPSDYFLHLSTDPAHHLKHLKRKPKKKPFAAENSRVKAEQEAYAGLQAVAMGKIEGPLFRSEDAEIEFYNQDECYDVKTSLHNKHLRTFTEETDEYGKPLIQEEVQSHLQGLVESIHSQVMKEHYNPLARRLRPVIVILDASYLSRNKALLLDAELSKRFMEDFPDRMLRLAFLSQRILKVDLAHPMGFQYIE